MSSVPAAPISASDDDDFGRVCSHKSLAISSESMMRSSHEATSLAQWRRRAKYFAPFRHTGIKVGPVFLLHLGSSFQIGYRGKGGVPCGPRCLLLYWSLPPH